MTQQQNGGRPIGIRVIETMEAIERIGPASVLEVFAAINCVYMSEARKYCNRAVLYGLAIMDDSNPPQRFRAVDNWRAMLKPVAQRAARRVVPPPAPSARPVSSVWELGSRA